ncbi:unnamed protein product [Lactuca saligna]|uniref:Uncharacterized protein n=1 Tax=Lactuca saligna TaxID=75948 RepID=A0AA35YQ55_LACSI|nr:unnamed protein product [Lactuca saligna]
MAACSSKSPRKFSKIEACIYFKKFQVSSFHFTCHRRLQSRRANRGCTSCLSIKCIDNHLFISEALIT